MPRFDATLLSQTFIRLYYCVGRSMLTAAQQHDEVEIVLKRVEVAAGLIDLAQRERALV